MKIVKEFILREIAGECVLVPTGATTQEFNGLITLSDTARFIWEHIEQADSLEDMVQKILEEYEIDEETARKDAIAFIGQLVGAAVHGRVGVQEKLPLRVEHLDGALRGGPGVQVHQGLSVTDGPVQDREVRADRGEIESRGHGLPAV